MSEYDAHVVGDWGTVLDIEEEMIHTKGYSATVGAKEEGEETVYTMTFHSYGGGNQQLEDDLKAVADMLDCEEALNI